MAAKVEELNGKVALVTGGSNGIGRGCVEILAEHGWQVAVWDIDDTEGAVAEKAYPDRVFYRHCDVTDEEQIKVGIIETIDKFGKLDCLVNNVGIHPEANTIDNYTTDDLRKLLELNLISCFAMCKHAIEHLRKSKGNIVNMSSVVVDNGFQQDLIYCTSKAGISTLTRCLALDEAKHGVRVNAIAPGAVRTPFIEKLANQQEDPEAAIEFFGSLNAMKRIGQAREIGKACLYLATDATYCTGSVLNASGGIEIGFGPKDNWTT